MYASVFQFVYMTAQAGTGGRRRTQRRLWAGSNQAAYALARWAQPPVTAPCALRSQQPWSVSATLPCHDSTLSKCVQAVHSLSLLSQNGKHGCREEEAPELLVAATQHQAQGAQQEGAGSCNVKRAGLKGHTPPGRCAASRPAPSAPRPRACPAAPGPRRAPPAAPAMHAHPHHTHANASKRSTFKSSATSDRLHHALDVQCGFLDKQARWTAPCRRGKRRRRRACGSSGRWHTASSAAKRGAPVRPGAGALRLPKGRPAPPHDWTRLLAPACAHIHPARHGPADQKLMERLTETPQNLVAGLPYVCCM